MRLTLDHNVVIDLLLGTPRITRLRQVLGNSAYEAYVVEIGASEMRKRGVKPDRYDLFEQLLRDAGLVELQRLSPMAIWDVTFWDRALSCDDTMNMRAKKIEDILFGASQVLDITNEPENSPKVGVWLNRTCDIQSMWCHLHYKNDIFVTSDENFHKKTKLPRLLALGAGQVVRPDEL